jgi:hypothetical protein
MNAACVGAFVALTALCELLPFCIPSRACLPRTSHSSAGRLWRLCAMQLQSIVIDSIESLPPSGRYRQEFYHARTHACAVMSLALSGLRDVVGVQRRAPLRYTLR